MNIKAKELAIHDKDTGSSEIQIALLTEKIEILSKHIKQFKIKRPHIKCKEEYPKRNAARILRSGSGS